MVLGTEASFHTRSDDRRLVPSTWEAAEGQDRPQLHEVGV